MEDAMQESQRVMEQCRTQLERRKREIDLDHERVLQGLHEEVKDKVTQIDAETMEIREALTTEQVKKKHLDRMLKKYGGGGGGSAATLLPPDEPSG